MYKLILTSLSALFLILNPAMSFANTETTSDYAKSSAITADVKSKLLAEPGIRSLKISVETVNGKVILKGNVENQQQKETASTLAAQVNGVTSVENDLVVQAQ